MTQETDEQGMGASAKPTGLSQAEPVARLGPAGFDPSRWQVGDILRADGDIWRVTVPSPDYPDWVFVERLFCSGCPIINVPCGHAYPPENEIWRRFERLTSVTDRYASAIEAGTAKPFGLGPKDESAVAKPDAQTEAPNDHPTN